MYNGNIDEILVSLSYLTREQIEEVLDYYQDHKQEIDDDIAKNNEIYEKGKAEQDRLNSLKSSV